jgi:hypothetical protein
MKLVQSILTKNDCYKSGRKITVKGLMLHSVGCPQSNASVFVKNWNRSDLEACVHGFIDGNTGTVYQPFLGTTGAGTLAEPLTTPILGLKCVNRPVSSTRVGQTSLVPI